MGEKNGETYSIGDERREEELEAVVDVQGRCITVGQQ